MTDGEANVGTHNTFDSAYGMLREQRIMASTTNSTTFETQVMRRFSKTCEAAKRDNVEVYIIALSTSGNTTTAFTNCAGGNYHRTANTDEIKSAFQDVAMDLIDLHLVQ